MMLFREILSNRTIEDYIIHGNIDKSTLMMQVRLMVDPFSMKSSAGPRIEVTGWMTVRWILCSRCGVVDT